MIDVDSSVNPQESYLGYHLVPKELKFIEIAKRSPSKALAAPIALDANHITIRQGRHDYFSRRQHETKQHQKRVSLTEKKVLSKTCDTIGSESIGGRESGTQQYLQQLFKLKVIRGNEIGLN